MTKTIISCLVLLLSLYASSQRPVPSAGRLVRLEAFPSEYVDARNIDIWLPEGYDTQNTRYAVLYMHDGQNLFDPAFSYGGTEWQVDETLSGLMATAQVQQCIVVGIWNTPKRFLEYAPLQPFELMTGLSRDETLADRQYGGVPLSSEYLKFIVRELKPAIDKKFATLSDPGNTYIAGSSMGGLISLYALTEYPGVFGGAACLSTHWPLRLQNNSSAFTTAMIKYLAPRLDKMSAKKIYFDYGTETLDAWYEPHQLRIDSLFKAKRYSEENFMSKKFEGDAHNEASWAKRLHNPLKFLLRD